MRRAERTWIASTLVATAFAIPFAAAGDAAAAVREPPGSPYRVAVDARGRLVPFTIVADGFAPGALVYAEQCDGAAPTTPDWDPTVHCDLGSADAPAIADGRGVATFATSDPQRVFRPFTGPSPQQLFNCIGAADATPANGAPTFRTCQVRVASNLSSATADQSFFTLALPSHATSAPPPPGPVTPTTTSGARPTTTTRARRDSPTTRAGASTTFAASTTAAVAAGSSAPGASGPTGASHGDGDGHTGVVVAVVAIVALAAAGVVLNRRRTRH